MSVLTLNKYLTKLTLIDTASETITIPNAATQGRFIEGPVFIAKDDLGNYESRSEQWRATIQASNDDSTMTINQDTTSCISGNITGFGWNFTPIDYINYNLTFIGVAGRIITVWVKWRMP